MIVRRFGSNIHSVEPQFNARAMTEIAFRRTGSFSLSREELEESYAPDGERELSASAEGDVKTEVEQKVLDELEAQLRALAAELGTDAIAIVENESGKDYPKTRDRTTNTVVGSENRLHFSYTIDPPLRLSIYRKR